MGVTTNPIYASEALFPMPFPAKSFQKNYVPFVGRTDAPKSFEKTIKSDDATEVRKLAAVLASISDGIPDGLPRRMQEHPRLNPQYGMSNLDELFSSRIVTPNRRRPSSVLAPGIGRDA